MWVVILPDTKFGYRIVLPGEGNSDPDGMSSGDLAIVLQKLVYRHDNEDRENGLEDDGVGDEEREQ